MQHSASILHTPYLDTDLFDFVTSLPAASFRERPLHIDVISRAYNSFESIPYSASITQLGDTKKFSRKLSLDLIEHLYFEKNKSTTINAQKYTPALIKTYLSGDRTNLNWLSPVLMILIRQIEQSKNQ
jgi:hypothetical protein